MDKEEREKMAYFLDRLSERLKKLSDDDLEDESPESEDDDSTSEYDDLDSETIRKLLGLSNKEFSLATMCGGYTVVETFLGDGQIPTPEDFCLNPDRKQRKLLKAYRNGVARHIQEYYREIKKLKEKKK